MKFQWLYLRFQGWPVQWRTSRPFTLLHYVRNSRFLTKIAFSVISSHNLSEVFLNESTIKVRVNFPATRTFSLWGPKFLHVVTPPDLDTGNLPGRLPHAHMHEKQAQLAPPSATDLFFPISDEQKQSILH